MVYKNLIRRNNLIFINVSRFRYAILSYFIIIFGITSPSIVSQNAKLQTFEHLSPDNGMNSYIAPCMIQDSKGYLWFGTYNGVDRYDGNGFTSYKHEPGNPNSINSGSVQALCESKDGSIWIGTSLGLDKLNPATDKFSHFILHPSTSGIDFSNYILSICEDNTGTLWIGTGDGLNKFNKTSGKFSTFLHNDKDSSSLSNNYIHALLIDKEGSLWVGTGNGLDKLDRNTGKFIHYWHDPQKRNGSIKIDWDNSIEYSLQYQVNAIYEDNSGMIWLCTNGEGLVEVNPKNGSFTTYKHSSKDPESLTSLTSDNIEAISQDRDGLYWIGTKYNGLNTFNKRTNKYSHYYHNEFDPGSLSINMILAIYCERSGTIWITSFNGLNKVNRKEFPFKQYNNIENSWDKSFGTGASIINGNNGKLWIQTDNGELLKFDPEKNSFALKFNCYKTGMNYIAEDNLGNIWMKSYSGGIYLKERNGKITRIKYSSGKEFNQQIYCIYAPPSNDTVWVGTLEGSIFFITKHSKTISLINSVNTSIKCIYKDSFGLLWAGTKDAGLIQYNISQNKFNIFKSDAYNPQSISGDLITTIYEDKKRNVWFGTNIGLDKYIRTTNSFIHYTETEGLPDNLIFAIEGDVHGNLWFSTNKGIAKLNPNTGEVKNYDMTYGFTSNRFYFTGCETESGEIYFGGPGGITRFNPDSIKDNPYIPPIVITSFKIFSKSFHLGKEIKLPFNKNFLTFEFASLSYVNPERNRYAYKMEGVDNNWIYSGNRHYASYPNLAPGTYTFKVKGSNNDGIWNEAGNSILIIISPPWWKTTWAYITYSALILLSLYGARRYELNRVELKNKIQMDTAVLKEKEETDKIKSRFFANISHELRTPLTLILGPAEKIISKVSDENIIKEASIIKRNAKNLLQLVNQLLDLSKLEAANLKLEAKNRDIVAFVKELAVSFKSLSEEKNISFKISAEREFIELYFDKEKMTKILSNILSNAFQFTPKDGKINVAFIENINNVEIKIRDTGIGISELELPKLFDRFYQVDSSFTREYEGSGIGLALTKELVELHHGSISVKSEPGLWTEFTIVLPIGKEHLKPDEILKEEKSYEQEIYIDNKKYIRPDNAEINFYDEMELNTSKEDKTIILIVEDNYDMREYIKTSLDKNYIIEEAVNGEQGIRKAIKMIPDLIISDLMMPKVDGNEMTKILKNDEKTSHIPVIILTAKSDQENKLAGLKTGADDYLTKPFDYRELQIRVENLINVRKKLHEKYSGIEYIKPRNGEKKLSSIDEKFMYKVIDIIEKHISEEDFNIEDFCSDMAMSRTQLHRKLKALTGKSASIYIRSVKLSKAKKMIEDQKGNIAEIAYSVGFSSPAYFTKCFKEEFGYPPSAIV